MEDLRLKCLATSESITVYWEKETEWEKGIRYCAFLDKGAAETVERTHFQWENLMPDREYCVRVHCLTAEGKILASGECQVRTAKAKRRLDVRCAPYFAKGDGKSLNTEALQRAIDDCSAEDVVYFPQGTFLSGALRLHSNMEIYLEEGAILQGSSTVEDYRPKIPSRFEGYEMECYSSLLNMGELNHAGGCSCGNILIHGKGAILGGGRVLAEAVITSEREHLYAYLETLGAGILEYENADTIPGRARPRLINISNCENVRISGLTLGNGASWNVHMIYSTGIVTDHCTFYSENVWNGDGWDPDSSADCTIFACDFFTGDDSIAIKSGKNPEGNRINRPCEGIRIFDCHCVQGHGFTIGSEMSGGVRDVKIWDCDLSGGRYGIEIKGTKKRGGYVRNVEVLDCTLPRILFHSVGYNDDGEGALTPPVFEDCTFIGIRLLGKFPDKEKRLQSCTAIELTGFDVPGYEIRNIRFEKITLPASQVQTISMQYCKNISFRDLSVEPEEKGAIENE